MHCTTRTSGLTLCFSCKTTNCAQRCLCWQKSWGKQLRVRLCFDIHVETISISNIFLGHTHRETISTRNSIAIIYHLLLNSFNCFIIATKTYLCLYVSILWSDLESSRMCLWNKIPIPLFGARSNVYHPCDRILKVSKNHISQKYKFKTHAKFTL